MDTPSVDALRNVDVTGFEHPGLASRQHTKDYYLLQQCRIKPSNQEIAQYFTDISPKRMAIFRLSEEIKNGLSSFEFSSKLLIVRSSLLPMFDTDGIQYITLKYKIREHQNLILQNKMVHFSVDTLLEVTDDKQAILNAIGVSMKYPDPHIEYSAITRTFQEIYTIYIYSSGIDPYTFYQIIRRRGSCNSGDPSGELARQVVLEYFETTVRVLQSNIQLLILYLVQCAIVLNIPVSNTLKDKNLGFGVAYFENDDIRGGNIEAVRQNIATATELPRKQLIADIRAAILNFI